MEGDQNYKEKKSYNIEVREKNIIDLKIQLEEAKQCEEIFKTQLRDKEENCERLEDGILSLRKDL